MKKLMLCFLIVFLSTFFFSANFYASSTQAQSENIARLASSIDLVTVDLFNNRILIGQNPYFKNLREPKIYRFADIDKGPLVLVNQKHPVSKDFYNPNSIDLNDKLPTTKNNLKLASEAAQALIDLFDAAKNDGVKNLTIVSAYRSYSYQNYLQNRKIDFYLKQGKSLNEAKKLAATVVALPGTSEHQTSLAVDLSSREILKNGGLEQNFESTPEGIWLRYNAYKFGFILRYPADKQSITGIIYEPWHFRYVGKPHSEIIYKNKFCLEEYIDYLKKNKKFKYTSENGKKFLIHYLENIRNIKEIEVWAYTGQAIGASLDNTGGLILTLEVE